MATALSNVEIQKTIRQLEQKMERQVAAVKTTEQYIEALKRLQTATTPR